jgi:hypothetical protein
VPQVHRRTPALRLVIPVAALVAALALPLTGLAAAPPDLGRAEGYAIVANTTITNTGVSLIDGNLALVGPSVTGLGGVVTGTSDIGNAAAANAEDDVLRAHHDATGTEPATEMSGVDLGGKTLGPGVYHFGSSAALHGTLTLDGEGASNPTFIFQIGSTLTPGTGAGSIDQRRGRLCGVLGRRQLGDVGTATSLQGSRWPWSASHDHRGDDRRRRWRNSSRAFAQSCAIALDAIRSSRRPDRPRPPRRQADSEPRQADRAADRATDAASASRVHAPRVGARPTASAPAASFPAPSCASASPSARPARSVGHHRPMRGPAGLVIPDGLTAR